MQVESVEVYSDAYNSAVMRVPGRRFPGSLVQGDSLSSLVFDLKEVCARVADLNIEDEELRHGLHSIQERLLDRLLHYQEVLTAHRIEVPGPIAGRADFIRLVDSAAGGAF